MKKLYVTTMTAAVLGFALTSTAVAQESALSEERTTGGSCENVDWNSDLMMHHPSLIDACQEVIEVDGKTWARFDANFVRVESDGDVIFSVRDDRDRAVEEVTLDPNPGQVAYIDDRPRPFSSLRTTDQISLYVPEGQYGFATQTGASDEELASVVLPSGDPVAVNTRNTDQDSDTRDTDQDSNRLVAQRDTNRSVLPTTAGPLPWLALAGFLAMLGGLGLTLRRWF